MSGAEGADIWKAGMMAAAMVAVSYGIGKLFGDVQALINDGAINGMEVARAAAHGISGGIAEQINGGDFGAGFASSFVGSAAGSAMQSGAMGRFFEGKDASAVFKRTTAAAIIGGTTAEIGGGKFANGAMTAAIQHLFNHEADASSKNAQAKLRKALIVLQDEGFDISDAIDSGLTIVVADRLTVTVTYDDGSSKSFSAGGVYDPESHTLTVITGGKSIKEIASSMLHEAQHILHANSGLDVRGQHKEISEYLAYERQGMFNKQVGIALNRGVINFYNKDGSVNSSKFITFFKQSPAYGAGGLKAVGARYDYKNKVEFCGGDL